jgi:hypothetical protein
MSLGRDDTHPWMGNDEFDGSGLQQFRITPPFDVPANANGHLGQVIANDIR